MNRLITLISELKEYEGKSKSLILTERIQERLDKSLVEYYNSVTKAFDKLDLYNENYELKLIKKLNKE